MTKRRCESCNNFKAQTSGSWRCLKTGWLHSCSPNTEHCALICKHYAEKPEPGEFEKCVIAYVDRMFPNGRHADYEYPRVMEACPSIVDPIRAGWQAALKVAEKAVRCEVPLGTDSTTVKYRDVINAIRKLDEEDKP